MHRSHSSPASFASSSRSRRHRAVVYAVGCMTTVTIAVVPTGILGSTITAAAAGHASGEGRGRTMSAQLSVSVACVARSLPADPSNRVADDSSAQRSKPSLLRHAAQRQRKGIVRVVPPSRAAVPRRSSARARRRHDRSGTMPIAGTAHGAWFFLDGRTDSRGRRHWDRSRAPSSTAARARSTPRSSPRTIATSTPAVGPLPSLDGLRVMRAQC